MKYIQGGPSGPSIVNGGPSPLPGSPALSMAASWYSNPISLVAGFVAPDMVTVSCPYSVASSPQGTFFLQGSISGFGVTGGVPGPNDWYTLPNTPIPISPSTYYQNIGGLTLPVQPATFRIDANHLIGTLFLRVGYAFAAGGSTDTASVYAVAVANFITGLS